MASGDTLVQLGPRDFYGTDGRVDTDPFGVRANGVAPTISLPPKVDSAVYAVKRLPKTAALATGATVKLLISDDPSNPMPSKVVKLGVNFGKLGAATAYVAPADAALGTEATGTVTLPATSGQTVEASIAIVAANMADAAADLWTEIRVRRLGSDSADTGKAGRLLLHGVSVLDT